MCKVSVIVPIYNIKQYLPRCIDSIRNQTMEDIEIILIDDGSTDGCSELCDQYASVDSRIRVLHKENEGLSAARNDGIQMARADYIMFADGDDWVEPGFCEFPYQTAIIYKAEVVSFHFNYIIKDGKKTKSDSAGAGLLAKGDFSTLRKIEPNAWSKLYHKSLFDSIHYPVGHVYEDIATTHRILHAANRVFLLNQYLYNYCVNRSGSITETSSPESIRDYYDALSLKFQDYANWGIDMNDENNIAALKYLTRYGRKTDRADYWASILHGKKRLAGNASWKQNAAFSIYRISPFLFDMVCVLTNRRKG